jgi:SnoaL-like domain
MTPAEEVAGRFAAALDADDFFAARLILAENCRYDVRGETFVGPASILDSYRLASDAAHREFGWLTYSHRVVRADATGATVEFTDRIERAGAEHTFRSLQHLTIADGLIIAIQHEDLPGEREKLEQFRKGLG